MIHLHLHGVRFASADIPVLEHEISEVRIWPSCRVRWRFRTVPIADRIASSDAVARRRAEGNVVGPNFIQIVTGDQPVHARTQIRNAEGSFETEFTLHGDVVLIDSRSLQAERNSIDGGLAAQKR